ncbi:zincin-like metallopeptidase domain-containing protein [Parabacteroides distasonis]|uniref:zincin-like metallopeptidase domain-containing protein n=1 Tax=Parabacteroides distasonis TaxID=823 RepID=UPI003F972B74
MKEKSKIEKNAEERQINLLSAALGDASDAKGYWLNASGKGYPRMYPHGVSASPFNALFMALHSDKNGCKTNLFTLFSDAKARGTSVREHEQGVPFLYYNWNKYVHRNNPEEFIDRKTYLTLDEEQKKQYKGVHNREIRTLFNIDQTTFPHVNEQDYAIALKTDGGIADKGYSDADERKLHTRFNNFLLKMRDSLVPVRYDGSGMPHYETDKDAVYMPRQRNFEHYHDYVQETLRQIVSATGHQQRLAREGMVMKNGIPPSEDAVKQERLVVEIASGIKMLELGLPAKLSEENLKTVEYWNRELKENPNLIDALESDVNNALEVIHKAERGEKIEYATFRNRKQTSDMKEQLPKHYFVADEIRKHPDKDDKTIVIVIDPTTKSADVILPAGASPEVDNEIPGLNKARIGRALRREGVKTVRFFNPDGALGYRPDDRYFAEKQVSLARLKNWSLEVLSTLNVTPAVKRANEIGFDKIQMIQDDKNRWALYIKPEHQKGYSIYPDKEDVNRFFSTLKQAMDNIDKVRMELAHKYYALAEIKPDLKVDLFNSGTQDIDLNRIQRVSVFKTKQDGVLCVATIDGQKLQPRSVTPQQWQRMWVAEDRDSYKRHLAATLFADVLQKGQSQEEHAGESQGEADSRQQDNNQQSRQTELRELSIKDIPEELYDKYERIKEEQPEAVVIFKHGNNYYASMYDAETIANELHLPSDKERVPYDANKIILVSEHGNEELRQQIHTLQPFMMDCDMFNEQQNKSAETIDEQNENEQRPSMRR